MYSSLEAVTLSQSLLFNSALFSMRSRTVLPVCAEGIGKQVTH